MRLISIYFAVATLGVGEMIVVTLCNWVGFTRGPMGIRAIPASPCPAWGPAATSPTISPSPWRSRSPSGSSRLTHSYYGNALRSLREDDDCAEAMGVDVVRLKIEVFAFSWFFAGIAGALWAHTTNYISPRHFRFSESILILSMIVVGGLGSVPGAASRRGAAHRAARGAARFGDSG